MKHHHIIRESSVQKILRDQHQKSSGSSVVIGFVLILMMLTAVITFWAFAGLPEQIANAEEVQTTSMQNSFVEYKIASDNMRLSDIEGARASILLPAVNCYSGGSIKFEPETGGVVTITADDSVIRSIGMSRLTATSFSQSGKVTIGYENGGVFYEENGVPMWVTPGLLQIYPDNETGCSVTEMIFISLDGEPEISGNRYVPLSSTYQNKTDEAKTWYTSAAITITTDDSSQRDLWYTMFRESEMRWNAYTLQENTGFVTISTDRGSDFARLTLTSLNPHIPSHIFVREALYNVTIIPVVDITENC